MKRFLAALALVLFSTVALADELLIEVAETADDNVFEIHYSVALDEPLQPDTPIVVTLVVDGKPQVAYFNRPEGMFSLRASGADGFSFMAVLQIYGQRPIESRILNFVPRSSTPRVPTLEDLRRNGIPI
jgi:hypothetical protein